MVFADGETRPLDPTRAKLHRLQVGGWRPGYRSREADLQVKADRRMSEKSVRDMDVAQQQMRVAVKWRPERETILGE